MQCIVDDFQCHGSLLPRRPSHDDCQQIKSCRLVHEHALREETLQSGDTICDFVHLITLPQSEASTTPCSRRRHRFANLPTSISSNRRIASSVIIMAWALFRPAGQVFAAKSC